MKHLMTHLAQLGLFVEVRLLVRREIARLSEPFVAVRVGADVRFLACMRPQMRPQVEIQREALAAECALKRLLSGMHELVPLEF